ncbi:phage tail fiber assembly protein [Yersinia kristensenii]|nr:phage tail fiber assembly protein [Yersinia kristensenii]
MKINILDSDGFYIEDHVEGDLPQYWTSDLVGNGYYKAQYQDANINDETGELSNGNWVETGGEDLEKTREQLINFAIIKKEQLIDTASQKISILNDRIEMGQDRNEELRIWKVYRLNVDDIDPTILPIEWPVIPIIPSR